MWGKFLTCPRKKKSCATIAPRLLFEWQRENAYNRANDSPILPIRLSFIDPENTRYET
jgi:hypothetical protein